MLDVKLSIDIQHGNRKATRRNYLENLRRGLARVLRDGRIRLLVCAGSWAWPVKDQRDQMFAILFAGHKAKILERDRRIAISDRNLARLQVENGPVVLIGNHKIEIDLIGILRRFNPWTHGLRRRLAASPWNRRRKNKQSQQPYDDDLALRCLFMRTAPAYFEHGFSLIMIGI